MKRRHQLLGAAALAILAVAPAGGQTQTHAMGAALPRLSGPLTLQRAVDIATKDSLMVHQAEADARMARADTGMARSDTRPQIAASGYLIGSSMETIMSAAPSVMPANPVALPANGTASANVGLMAPLYTGGRLSGLLRAAQQNEKAASAGLTVAQLDAARAVKEAYYRSLLSNEMVKAAQARVDAATALQTTTQAQYEAGKGIQASVLRVQAELADAQRTLVNAQTDQAKALLDLKEAIGISFDSDVTLSDALVFDEPGGTLEDHLATAEHVRPEIDAARARALAAGAQIDAARGSSDPQVYAAAMVGGTTSRDMGSTGDYMVGLVVSVPIGDGGLRRSQVERARAQRDRAQAELAHLILQIDNEVHHAWLDLQAAGQNYRTAQTAVTAAQAAYDVATLRVQNQKSILVEQLDALAALTQARANLAQALYDHAAAAARLDRAMGEM